LEDYEVAYQNGGGKVILLPQEVDVDTQQVRAAE